MPPTANVNPTTPAALTTLVVVATFAAFTPASMVAHQQAGSSPARRVALVTGSTDGLGRGVALRIAATGAHVIVHGRSVERGQAVVDEITRAGTGSARFYQADLASLAAVRDLAERVLRDYDRLDVLVNNAGIIIDPTAGDGGARNTRRTSADGHELVFAVNYLSGYLLTRLLLPRLIASAPARIVNVASLGQSPIDFDDPMLERGFSDNRAYGQSKLAQIMFTFDVAQELEGTGVSVNALHPATYMATTMVRTSGITPRSTVAEGADAVMHLVTGTDVGSGRFFAGTAPTRANAQAYDGSARTRLRELSRRLTGK